jgi:MFS family permease
MRSTVHWISVATALGGLPFGFDIAVINGALVFRRTQFQLSDLQTEVAVSSLLLGCVFGASLAGTLSDASDRSECCCGRRCCFWFRRWARHAPNLAEFTAACPLGGITIGMESMLSPLYVAEIFPARIRGRLVALNQLATVAALAIIDRVGRKPLLLRRQPAWP